MANPIDSYRIGPVHASTFRNQGQQGSYLSTTIHRRFRDKDGNWDTADSYSLVQLLALREAADKAIAFHLSQDAVLTEETPEPMAVQSAG